MASFHRFPKPVPLHIFAVKIAVITALLALIPACSPVGMLTGAAATGALAVAEERPVGTVVDDFTLKLLIEKKLLEKNGLFTKVSVDVVEARVLLTGKVEKPDQRIEVTRKTWSVDGVREVINNIEISEPAGIAEYTRDLLLATKLRTRLMGDVDVRAINYSIESSDRVLYIMGIAQDERELSRVISHARLVSGVRDVVNYVRIKDATLSKTPKNAAAPPA